MGSQLVDLGGEAGIVDQHREIAETDKDLLSQFVPGLGVIEGIPPSVDRQIREDEGEDQHRKEHDKQPVFLLHFRPGFRALRPVREKGCGQGSGQQQNAADGPRRVGEFRPLQGQVIQVFQDMGLGKVHALDKLPDAFKGRPVDRQAAQDQPAARQREPHADPAHFPVPQADACAGAGQHRAGQDHGASRHGPAHIRRPQGKTASFHHIGFQLGGNGGKRRGGSQEGQVAADLRGDPAGIERRKKDHQQHQDRQDAQDPQGNLLRFRLVRKEPEPARFVFSHRAASFQSE